MFLTDTKKGLKHSPPSNTLKQSERVKNELKKTEGRNNKKIIIIKEREKVQKEQRSKARKKESKRERREGKQKWNKLLN